MPETNRLLPCPFCGQLDRVIEHTASVECNRCGARIIAEWGKDDAAHKRWNTRPPIHSNPCSACDGTGEEAHA